MSHNFSFNVKYFYERIHLENKYEQKYLTFNYFEYLNLKNKINCLYVGNPYQLYQFLNSNVILVGNGMYLHKFLKNIFKFKSIYINHGVFIGTIEKFYKNYLYYDEIWHFSEFEKEQFKNYLSDVKQVVTGFPITYNYIEFLTTGKIENNNQFGIIAFTSYNTDNYKNNLFSINNEEFLNLIEKLSIEFDFNFVIQLHPGSKLTKFAKKKINKSKNLDLIFSKKSNLIQNEFLNAKFMITDISSIYIHFLLTEKPILFVLKDNQKVLECNDFYNNIFIKHINKLTHLEKGIKDLIKNNLSLDNELLQLKRQIYKNLELDKILETCINRLDKILLNE